jgi:hypothetical protein
MEKANQGRNVGKEKYRKTNLTLKSLAQSCLERRKTCPKAAWTK